VNQGTAVGSRREVHLIREEPDTHPVFHSNLCCHFHHIRSSCSHRTRTSRTLKYRRPDKQLTWRSSSAAKAQANWAVNVDLPTPPFPLSTRILRFTVFIRSLIRGIEGSGALVAPEAQISWFAQPLQASDLPAFSDSVPCCSS